MSNRKLFPLLVLFLLVLPFFSGTTALASMPAINRFKEGVAAVQGVWYDLDGNEAYSAEGDSFDGRKILDVTGYGGSAEAANVDFCLEGKDGEKRRAVPASKPDQGQRAPVQESGLCGGRGLRLRPGLHPVTYELPMILRRRYNESKRGRLVCAFPVPFTKRLPHPSLLPCSPSLLRDAAAPEHAAALS